MNRVTSNDILRDLGYFNKLSKTPVTVCGTNALPYTWDSALTPRSVLGCQTLHCSQHVVLIYKL